MTKSDQPYLRHILDAIHHIEEYSTSLTFVELEQSQLLQDGFIRQLAIIGEASNHLSEELTTKYSQIPWIDIVSMRNKIIQG